MNITDGLRALHAGDGGKALAEAFDAAMKARLALIAIELPEV